MNRDPDSRVESDDVPADGGAAGPSTPGSQAEDEPDPLIGTTVGLYRIEELAGRGGMGRVYRAWHTRLELDVALKVLPRDRLADRSRRRRFLREAKAASVIDWWAS